MSTAGQRTTFTYEANSKQLTSLLPLGDIVTYAYNGDGLRVWQDDGVDEVRYVHDGNNVLLETEGLGTVEAEFTYIPQAYAQVISQLRSGDSALEMGSGVNSAQHPVGHLAIDS